MPYSQFGEDAAFLPLLPEHGRLLDIGAGPPTTFSNSRALIEQGWVAVLVEPSPSAFLALFQEYKGNPRVQLVNCAVTDDSAAQLSRMHYTEDLVSTINQHHYELWCGTANYLGSYWVPVMPFNWLLAILGHFDFISIDVEGHSAELIEAALTAKPQAICVEHDNQVAWIKSKAVGYREVLCNGTNLVLAR